MSEILRTPLHEVDGRNVKYYKFQIKGWLNFDPTGKTLGEIAEGIEDGRRVSHPRRSCKSGERRR